MASMNQDQLTEHIKATVLPLIKDGAGPLVAEAVREQLAKQQTTSLPANFAEMLAAAAGKITTTTSVVRDKGLAFGRYVRAIANSKREGTGVQGALKTLEAWGDKDMVDTAQKALSASSGTGGGFLVPEEFSNDLIPLRRAMTVVRSFGPREYPMPNGTINIPKITSGASGGYIGENAAPTVSQPAFGQVTLTWKKLAVIVPISNDLLRYSAPSADAIVRDDIVKSLAVTEDQAFLRADGTNGSPKGIRWFVPAGNIVAANATVSLANTISDLGSVILKLLNGNIPLTKPGWIMAPRTWNYLITITNTSGFYVFRDEMLRGSLWGFPFKMTTSVPITQTVGSNSDCSELYFVNFDDMAIGDSQRLVLDVSSEAAYTSGSSTYAAFSLDQTVVRAIAEHDFAARDANAIAVATGVRWA